jgi:SRSO17 transposase
MEQIRQAVERQVPTGVVLADAGYGIDTKFRTGIDELGLQYVMGIQSSVTVWEPGQQPLPAKSRMTMGRPSKRLQRAADHQPVSVKELALSLPSSAFHSISWREGTERSLRSRLPPLGCVLPIGITKEPNHTRNNGY